LEHFKPFVVGRSRNTDISLKRTEHYRLQTDEERDKDTSAKTVSARQFQITYFNIKSIELKNLSSNGTRLDGKLIQDKAVISDIMTRAHEISFGADSRFRLEMREVQEENEPLPL